MNHPSILFIKSLAMLGKTATEINELLKEFGLPDVPEEHINFLEDIVTSFEGKTRADFDVLDPKFDKLAKEENVYFLIHPDEVVATCTRLLNNPAVKRDLYVSLIGRLDPSDISDHINEVYELDITETTVKVFSNYYFNVNLLGHEDWNIILPQLPCAEASYYKSSLDGGATVAAYKLGRDENVSIREAVQAAVTGLYASLQEMRSWSASPAKVKVLSDAISALAKAHNVINTADQELASVAQELRQFKLEKQKNKTISLKALSKGKHSGVRELENV